MPSDATSNMPRMDEGTTPAARNAARRRYSVAEIDELNEAADAVEKLMRSDGWPILMEILERERARTLRDLDRSDPPGRAVFARAHGFAGGLLVVRDRAQALVDRRKAVMEEQRRKHEGELAATAGRG